MTRATLFVAAVVLSVAAARAADDPAVAVVKKCIEAHGGEEALKKAKGGEFKLEGEVTLGADKGKFTSTISYALPDKFRMSVDTTLGTSKYSQVIVVNGDKVKATTNGKAQELKDAAKAEFLQMAAIQEVNMFYPLLDEKRFTLKAEKDQKFNDKDVAVVLVTRKGMKDVRMYFDKTSGELAGWVYKLPDALGSPDVLTEVTVSENKKFDGILQPTVHKVKQLNKETMSFKLLEAKVVEKPDLKAYVID